MGSTGMCYTLKSNDTSYIVDRLENNRPEICQPVGGKASSILDARLESIGNLRTTSLRICLSVCKVILETGLLDPLEPHLVFVVGSTMELHSVIFSSGIVWKIACILFECLLNPGCVYGPGRFHFLGSVL